MKKGTIFENKYAGYKTYFVYMGFPAKSGKWGEKKTCGFSLDYINGKWHFRVSEYYEDSLRETEKFQAVGFVNLEKICINAILDALNQTFDRSDANSDATCHVICDMTQNIMRKQGEKA